MVTIQPWLGSRRFQRTLFAGWCLAVTIPSVALLANHLIALPAAAVSDHAATGRWELRHVLGEDCGCSASIADALLARGPVRDVAERITFIGEPSALTTQLSQHGFAVEFISAEKAATEGLRGAPWLLIFDRKGQIAYSGGYAQIRPRAGIPPLDLTLLAELQQGKTVGTLPAFGCATSTALRRQLDPLGLKYSQ